MSAVEESADGAIQVIQVLFALHPSFGAQELCGPLEVLSSALHKINNPRKTCLFFTSPSGLDSYFVNEMAHALSIRK